VELLSVIGWPVLDRIGPVSPHGLGIALGYLGGSWWMLREGRKRGLNEDHVGTILLWALVGAIFGARFFYVLGHLEDFDSFVDMLKIWEGGISLIGGIAGGVFFAYPVMRRYGYRFLQVMDSAAIGIAFGIMIGRIGDLVIGDHLGKPTLFPGAWAYRGGELPGPWTGSEATGWVAPLEGGQVEQLTRESATLCNATPDGFGCAEVIAQGPGVHQTALYDFVIAIGLFLLLRWLSKQPRREGVLIMSFAIVYGTGRVITDFLRVDKTYFGLTGSQLTAIGVIAISVFVLLRYWRNPLPEQAAGQLPGEGGATTVGQPEGPTTDFEPPREPGVTEPGPGSTERGPGSTEPGPDAPPRSFD
jgi:prolipoprotein diacylglyceryltransferase